MKNTETNKKTRKPISNNMLLFLVGILLAVSFTAQFAVHKTINIDSTTGAVSIATVGFCVATSSPTELHLINPSEGQIVSGSITLNASLNATNKTNEWVKFYLSRRGDLSAFQFFLGREQFKDDTYYWRGLDTTTWDDGNCFYQIYALGFSEGGCGQEDGDSSEWITINNIDQAPFCANCTPGITTNFSAYSSWANFSNASFGKEGVGQIHFRNGTRNIDNLTVGVDIIIERRNISTTSYCLRLTSATLSFYNLTYIDPVPLLDGLPCEQPTCWYDSQREGYVDGTFVFNVSPFRGTFSVGENSSPHLVLTDTVDICPGGCNLFRGDTAFFYANLTNENNTAPINSSQASCEIWFNDTGTLISHGNMTYNATSGGYTLNRTFDIPGQHVWKVVCNLSNDYFVIDAVTKTNQIYITNLVPAWTSILPNATWTESSNLLWVDLDDYVTDPENDSMNFSASSVFNINVEINSTSHQVLFSPTSGWSGNRTVFFTVTDEYGGEAISNVVTLLVVPAERADASSTSGGGGGGGSQIKCIEFWDCENWGPCLPTGIQVRTCSDLANCGTELDKPNEMQPCDYEPTCSDLIKNQGETGVDCGGPCPPCPTCNDGIQNQGEAGIDCGGPCNLCSHCHDGIQNQGETGIDCGGPCSPCPTCNDEIQNQGETGIDCGGPCDACSEPETQQPVGVEKESPARMVAVVLLSFIMVTGTALLFGQQLKRAFALLRKKMGLLFKKKEEEESPISIYTREQNILALLIALEKRIGKDTPSTILEEAYVVFRGALTELLNIKYQFTYEEFEKEIRNHRLSEKIKLDVIKFYKQVHDLRYGGVATTNELLTLLLRKMAKIVGILVAVKIKELGKTMIDSMNIIKLDIRAAIKKGKQKDARLAYKKLINLYNKLNKDDKKESYKDIKELYALITERERKRVSETVDTKKVLAVLLIMAATSFLVMNINPTTTGFAVLEGEFVVQEIEPATLNVGQTYKERVSVSGGVGELKYVSTNPYLFAVDKNGKITYTPTKEHIGKQTTSIIVEDETFDFRIIVVSVIVKE